MSSEKPVIDLTSWLNNVTNLPFVWENIIEECLTNRYGVFKYNYDGARTKKNEDGEIVYSKPYNIDLTITMDEIYTGDDAIDLDDEVTNEIYKILLVQEIMKVLDGKYVNDELSLQTSITAISRLLDDFSINPSRLDELYESIQKDSMEIKKEYI